MGGNSPPAANDDSAMVAKDSGATTIDVLANDTANPDSGETLTVIAVTQPADGTAVLAGDGSGVTFQPTAGFSGVANFTYTVSDGNGGSDVANVTMTVVYQQAYLKASNASAGKAFGEVVLSADGLTLAVGAATEDDGGAVYVFTRTTTTSTWTQQAYVKASTYRVDDHFGRSVALSADGSTLAVGAPSEDDADTGVGGDAGGPLATDSGAVYVFTRIGTTWTQQAFVKASNTDSGDNFGGSVALSADGSTLAVGATGERSATTGIDGDQLDNTTESAGAVYVFVRAGTVWTQQAYVKASNTSYLDGFGGRVALSYEGSTLAVGARGEDSAATGINGNPDNDAVGDSGAAYVFLRTGSTWTQQAYVKASNSGEVDWFGFSVALSADGSTLAIGALFEASAATGINGDQGDNTATAGAVYVFVRAGTVWTQQAYVKASNTGESDYFHNVALASDGSTLAVGADGEDGAATGINGNQLSNTARDAGAVYVFTRAGTVWSQKSYFKASNTNSYDNFGASLALSANGSTLAVAAFGEDSAATGINGDQGDNTAPYAGAVYVFQY